MNIQTPDLAYPTDTLAVGCARALASVAGLADVAKAQAVPVAGVPVQVLVAGAGSAKAAPATV